MWVRHRCWATIIRGKSKRLILHCLNSGEEIYSRALKRFEFKCFFQPCSHITVDGELTKRSNRNQSHRFFYWHAATNQHNPKHEYVLNLFGIRHRVISGVFWTCRGSKLQNLSHSRFTCFSGHSIIQRDLWVLSGFDTRILSWHRLSSASSASFEIYYSR